MKMYQRILVAIDISGEAEQVMLKAKSIAEQNQAKLDLIHVVEPVVIESTFDLTPMIDAEIEDNLVNRSKSFVSSMISRLGMTIDQVLVPVGSTKGEIHDAAKALGSDLIIIGTHGRHGVGLLLGSTANSVLHGAECDVLSVKVTKSD